MAELRERERNNVVNLKEADTNEVDDVLIQTQRPGAVVTRDDQTGRFRSAKLAESFKITSHNEEEMRRLAAGLNDRVAELGLVVKQAAKYQGFEEQLYSTLGTFFKSYRSEADALRHERLQHLNTDQAVREILQIVNFGIEQLGQSKHEYETKRDNAKAAIKMLLDKSAKYTPIYLAAKAKREQLEGQVQELGDELKSGTVEPAERPQKEQAFEELTQQLHVVAAEEIHALDITKEADTARPDRQAERDACEKSIIALLRMQTSFHEKYQNYASMLESEAVALRAQSNGALFECTDPVLNVTIADGLENVIAVAGGLTQAALQRAKIAAISPEQAKRLREQLRGHLNEASEELEKQETAYKLGPRAEVERAGGGDADAAPEAPADNGTGPQAAGQHLRGIDDN